jgi:hypothetical protein
MLPLGMVDGWMLLQHLMCIDERHLQSCLPLTLCACWTSAHTTACIYCVLLQLVWPALIAAGGIAGWASWWLGPWVVFHAWLSVLSLVQHTAPHIPWAEEVSGTLLMPSDCLSKRCWEVLLCFDFLRTY